MISRKNVHADTIGPPTWLKYFWPTYCWVKQTTELWPHSWSLPSWTHWLSPWLESQSLVPPHSFHSLQTLKTFRIILILVHCVNFDWSRKNFFDNVKLIFFFHFHMMIYNGLGLMLNFECLQILIYYCNDQNLVLFKHWSQFPRPCI